MKRFFRIIQIAILHAEKQIIHALCDMRSKNSGYILRIVQLLAGNRHTPRELCHIVAECFVTFCRGKRPSAANDVSLAKVFEMEKALRHRFRRREYMVPCELAYPFLRIRFRRISEKMKTHMILHQPDHLFRESRRPAIARKDIPCHLCPHLIMAIVREPAFPYRADPRHPLGYIMKQRCPA